MKYSIGAVYEANGKKMTINGSHRAGNHRGAKTLWHCEITEANGEVWQTEANSEKLKRIFWGEKKTTTYTSRTTGQRVVLSVEAIEKKAEGITQKSISAIEQLKEAGVISEGQYTKMRKEAEKKKAEIVEKLKAEALAKLAEKEAEKKKKDAEKAIVKLYNNAVNALKAIGMAEEDAASFVEEQMIKAAMK